MNEREPTPPPRSALDWPQHAGVTDVVLQEIKRQVRRRRRKVRARLAAGALALACALGITWRLALPRLAAPEMVSSAMVSIPDREILPDGTIVELNAGAKIRVDFNAGSSGPRRVELIAGAAHFQVTPDPDRPFVVVAGKIEVRAVGTAFAVQLAHSGVEVLVTEGRVAVEPTAPDPVATTPAAAAPLAVLDAGNRVVVEPPAAGVAARAPQVVTMRAEELDDRLAWRAPRLEFTDTRLGEVLRLFNQHCQVRLTLGEPGLAELRLSGIVRADNTSALLQLLGVEYGIDARPGGEGELVLVRAK